MPPITPNDQSNTIPPANLPGIAMPMPPAEMPGGIQQGMPGAPGLPGPTGLSGMPSGLPGVPGAGSAMPMPGMPSGASMSPMPSGSNAGGPAGVAPGAGAGMNASVGLTPSQQVMGRAQQLIATYGQDPHQLATLFGDLKADYLAREHHISPNTSGN